MQGNWFCIIVILAVVSLTLPHTVTPLTHRHGRIFSMAGAAEMRSPGRQMNLQGNSRSTTDGAFGENYFWGFCMKHFGMKADKKFHRCTDIICPCDKHISQYCNGKNLIVFCHGLDHFVTRHEKVWLKPYPWNLIVWEHLEDNIQKYRYK